MTVDYWVLSVEYWLLVIPPHSSSNRVLFLLSEYHYQSNGNQSVSVKWIVRETIRSIYLEALTAAVWWCDMLRYYIMWCNMMYHMMWSDVMWHAGVWWYDMIWCDVTMPWRSLHFHDHNLFECGCSSSGQAVVIGRRCAVWFETILLLFFCW